jgi:hypothetical protein
MLTFTEAEAKAVHQSDSQDITYEQAAACDKFVRTLALHQFKNKVEAMRAPVVLKDFIIDVVKLYYGSVEVDHLLVELKCYPEWW